MVYHPYRPLIKYVTDMGQVKDVIQFKRINCVINLILIAFIIKNLIMRIYKLEQNRQEIVKDTLLLFIVCYVILSCKNFFIPKNEKIEVFTNEPNF